MLACPNGIKDPVRVEIVSIITANLDKTNGTYITF